MDDAQATIGRFLDAVGSRAPAGEAAIVRLLALFPTTPVLTPFDRGDGSDTSYWGYAEDGVELLWVDKVLASATIFVQADSDQGYQACPFRLFREFGNDATRDEVVAALGEPSASGEWQGVWLRGDGIRGKNLRLEFDDRDRLLTAGVFLPA